jgi:hypothetical protein
MKSRVSNFADSDARDPNGHERAKGAIVRVEIA